MIYILYVRNLDSAFVAEMRCCAGVVNNLIKI